MSPASKSKTKSKDKTPAKSAKEQPKASIKSSGSSNSVTANPANAYNPISGTVHALEIPPVAAFPPLHDNGRFRNIDDTDEHSSSPHGTVSEFDSVSNNGSSSGESEDIKEKIANSTRQETIPGLDSDRREKIRQKNEKKHQRQRERRAQELHDRCSGYLMSRKLERLSQQLVAMGFSHEQAMLALMLNEGRVEESVNWLFEGSEEEAQRESKLERDGDLKIDINEELAQISAMEMRYKCSKQEVERAVVACEGHLAKAEEILQPQKKEPPATPPRQEYTAEPDNLRKLHEKPVLVASVTAQQRMDEHDFNNQPAIPVPPNSEPGSRNLQPLNQPKPVADKRWGATGSSPAFSSSMNAKQNTVPNASATPSVTAGWYSNNVPGAEHMRSNVKLLSNQSTGSLGLVNQSSRQSHHPVSFKENPFLYSGPVDYTSNGLGGTRSPSLTVPSQLLEGSYDKTTASLPSLAGSREWTSPFAGKDIFSLPRQFVSSPSP